MKPYAFGAAAVVVWTVLVFFVGRASIPDRTAEVEAWRDSATVTLARSLKAEARRDSAEARTAAAVQRAAAGEARLAGALERAAAGAARTAALEADLAAAVTVQDTVAVQAAVIASQREELREARVAVRDAWEVAAELRGDLARALEQQQEDRRAIQRLEATVAAGLAATRPSRGTGATLKALALGVGLGVVGWELAR